MFSIFRQTTKHKATKYITEKQTNQHNTMANSKDIKTCMLKDMRSVRLRTGWKYTNRVYVFTRSKNIKLIPGKQLNTQMRRSTVKAIKSLSTACCLPSIIENIDTILHFTSFIVLFNVVNNTYLIK